MSEETAVDVRASVEFVGATVMDELLDRINRTVDNAWLDDSVIYAAHMIFLLKKTHNFHISWTFNHVLMLLKFPVFASCGHFYSHSTTLMVYTGSCSQY